MTDMTPRDLIDELCDLYRTLIRNLNPNANTTNDGSAHHKPTSRPPISIDVSCDRARLDQLAENIARTLRTELGFQHHRPRTLRRHHTAWHISRHVCQLEPVETIDYATIATLRALPALLEAAPTEARRHLKDLDRLRRRVRVTLGIDKPAMTFTAACPGCQGWTVPLAEPQFTLRADVDEVRVWCNNPQCGYQCENPACWCAVPNEPGHTFVWDQNELLRLKRLLETA